MQQAIIKDQFNHFKAVAQHQRRDHRHQPHRQPAQPQAQHRMGEWLHNLAHFLNSSDKQRSENTSHRTNHQNGDNSAGRWGKYCRGVEIQRGIGRD